MIIDLNEVKQIDSLEVKYGDESYMIPLGNHLPLKRIKALKTDDDIIDFLAKYMPKKVVESLTVSQFSEIMKAWGEETRRVSGVTPGESKASPSSSMNTVRR